MGKFSTMRKFENELNKQ